MIIKQLLDNGRDSALVFFAGWGMDEFPFLQLGADFADVFIVYDYGMLSFDFSFLNRYREVHVVAWSMGVWAASQCLRGGAYSSFTAINGTERPVDDVFGIPKQIVEGTLDGLCAESLSRFNRRMCGSRRVLDEYLSHGSQRGIDDLRNELESILSRAQSSSSFSLPWTRVICGKNDLIFPAANSKRFWDGVSGCFFISIDAPHYPFYLWKSWEEIIF